MLCLCHYYASAVIDWADVIAILKQSGVHGEWIVNRLLDKFQLCCCCGRKRWGRVVAFWRMAAWYEMWLIALIRLFCSGCSVPLRKSKHKQAYSACSRHTVHFISVCQRLFGNNFFNAWFFRTETFMMCFNVFFYITRNKISVGSGKIHVWERGRVTNPKKWLCLKNGKYCHCMFIMFHMYRKHKIFVKIACQV